MTNLPRPTRAITTQVNPDTTPVPKRVLVVGRFLRPTCDNCDGFETVKVTIGGQLFSIHCMVCTAPAPATAGIVDDIEREDDRRGYEAEDLLAEAVAR